MLPKKKGSPQKKRSIRESPLRRGGWICYFSQTAGTSSVLPCGNPPSPQGKAYGEGGNLTATHIYEVGEGLPLPKKKESPPKKRAIRESPLRCKCDEIHSFAQTAGTSSVLPCGNPLDVLLAKLDGCLQHCSPQGKASRTVEDA